MSDSHIMPIQHSPDGPGSGHDQQSAPGPDERLVRAVSVHLSANGLIATDSETGITCWFTCVRSSTRPELFLTIKTDELTDPDAASLGFEPDRTLTINWLNRADHTTGVIQYHNLAGNRRIIAARPTTDDDENSWQQTGGIYGSIGLPVTPTPDNILESTLHDLEQGTLDLTFRLAAALTLREDGYRVANPHHGEEQAKTSVTSGPHAPQLLS